MSAPPDHTTPVRDAHRFDEAALGAWLSENVDVFDGPLTVRQFRGGQSNPTFWLTDGKRAFVLRKQPPGKLLPSAHAVDREYRVMRALHFIYQPVLKLALAHKAITLLAAVALLGPIFTSKQLYCHHICPHGALQQLLAKRLPFQWSPSKRMDAFLSKLPFVLLVFVRKGGAKG